MPVAQRHRRSRPMARGARVELALLHQGGIDAGSAAPWLKTLPVTLHHHIVEPADFGRVARLLTRRGVGLVLSGGGARGFAHLGIIRALREAKGTDRFRRRRQHRRHHRRRRGDGLER